MSAADVNTLVTWANNGAPEGDAKDAPPPLTFPEGWQIKPDMIIEMPKPFHVKATGTINYQNIKVQVNFPEDTWVVAAEMRAGNPKVVHHMRAIVTPPGATWMAKAVYGESYEEGSEAMTGAKEGTDLLGKYNPGLGAQRFDVDDSAKFVPKGSDIVFNIHYTSVGTEQEDLSKVGLVFAKKPPKRRYWMSPGTPAAFNLVIPAGDENAEVVSEVTVGVDHAELVYVQPHMHLRGKDYELRAIYPTGETQEIFKGKWNFDWQIGYELRKAAGDAEGHAAGGDRPLRQFAEQQVQSRSHQGNPLGRSELGRDAVRVPGPGGGREHQRRQDLHPFRTELVAARKIGPDARVRIWIDQVNL